MMAGKRISAAKARKALELQISDLQKRLYVKEKILQEFKIKFNVFNLASQTETLLTEISDLEAEKNQIARLLEEASANLEQILNASLQDQSKFRSVLTSIEDSDLIIEYKSKLLNLESDLATSEIELTSEHPDIKILKNQINVVQELLRKELRKNFASHILGRDTFYDTLVTQYIDTTLSIEGNKAKKKTLSEQIKKRENLLSQIPKKQLEYDQLIRDFEGLGDIYDSLVKASETAKSVEAMDLSRAFVNRLSLATPGCAWISFKSSTWVLMSRMPAIQRSRAFPVRLIRACSFKGGITERSFSKRVFSEGLNGNS